MPERLPPASADSDEPSMRKSSTAAALPKRAKLRSARLEPRWTKSSTDRQLPSCVTPKVDSVLPRRRNDLSEQERAHYRDKTAGLKAAAKDKGHNSISEYLTAQTAAAAKGKGFDSWSEYLTAQLAAAAKGEGFGSWSEYVKGKNSPRAQDKRLGSWR